MPLSVVLITKNAATQIDACLASASFADEIVVVDSGSTDETLEIAKRHGARIIEREWAGYGPQKQFAVESATHDWVLCLDADERVSPQLKDRILHELPLERAHAYAIPRCNRFLGRWLRHGEGYPDWSVRLFDRRRARWSDDSVHEKVICSTPPQRIHGGDLMHESAESLSLYLDKQNQYTSLQAERMHATGRKSSAARMLFSPIARFLKFYFIRLVFLDGVPGLVHIAIGCMNSFNKYAKMLELNQNRK